MRLFKTPQFFSWIFPRRMWGFSRSINTVYLTFDDGPNPVITPWILDYLKQEKIKATFFCVGSNIIRYPELFERIKSEGHTVGNHTMNHDKGTKVPFDEYKKSISETQLLVKNNLFRPPYGRIRAWQSHLLAKKYTIVMWSWLSYDFDPQVPIETIERKAKYQIKSGDILVMHDNDKVEDRVKELLPKLVRVIRDKEYTFSRIMFDV